MNVVDWLLDGDPSIRWQVLRDLTDVPTADVRAERRRVATEGWGARLLSLRDEDGQWAGGAYFPAVFEWSEDMVGQPWTSTFHVLDLLRQFGLDPADPHAVETIALVRDNCHWEDDGPPFFEGETEPCINGRVVAIGAYFGIDMQPLVERLLTEQLDDGGWNCEAQNGSVRSSFHTTIAVLDGLLAHERAARDTGRVVDARHRGEEYLKQRHLFRRLSTGEVVDEAWLQFSFPPHWHYDVLRALDYFREAGGTPDPRLEEAVAHVRSKQQPDGTWLLENTHPGDVHFPLEDDGAPSRWNTLRALRVLRWYDDARGAQSVS